MIEEGRLKQIKVLDKDDFIDCLVYCMFKGDISFSSLQATIKYFYYLFGDSVNVVLSKFRCDAYLADLEAASGFLEERSG